MLNQDKSRTAAACKRIAAHARKPEVMHNIMLRTTLFLLLAVAEVGVSQAAQTASIWAVDCSNTKTNYWFLMDEASNARYPILIGNSIKVTPYPGLHDVKNIHNDPRIIWVSNDQISVSNDNKRKLGWSGRLIFNRCKEPR